MTINKVNETLKQFLLEAREKSGLSQSEVAARSEVFGLGKVLDQRAVSRIETQPISVDAIKIAAYLTAIGLEPNEYYQLLGRINEQGSVYKMNTESLQESKIKIQEAISKITNARKKLLTYEHNYLDKDKLLSSFSQHEKSLETLNRKPVIGFFGHFDAGKSTIINTIINDNLLPVRYQPATCIVNLLMHFDDRPTFMNCDVAVFKKGFMPHMIYSEKDAKEYLIEEGNYELLNKLGLHDYNEDSCSEAYISIVFANSSILKSVWLLDTPGDLNSASETDTEIALGGVELVDGLAYISSFNGFMSGTDIGLASNILRQRKPVHKSFPLEHLMFIQSHCHSEINDNEIKRAKEDAFTRLRKQLNDTVFEHWITSGHINTLPEPEDLINKTVHFWRENDIYREQTLSQVEILANFLVKNQSEIIDQRIADIMSVVVQFVKDEISALNHKKQSAEDRIREVNDKDATFRLSQNALINEFNEVIASCENRKKQDREVMKTYYNSVTSDEGLEQLITETYSDKKKAQSEIGNYVGQLLTSKLETTIELSGKSISKEIDHLLYKWQHETPSINKPTFKYANDGSQIEIGDFNSRAAFIGGFAGLGSLGAMALYVSTIASNLGAYILVGKAAGVLVSLGLVSSVTTVTSFVAAIGGPITIGIVLASLVGLIVYRLSGGSWQKSLAKKASEAIRKEDVDLKIDNAVVEFWDNTAKAVQAGLDELIMQTDQHIEKMKKEACETYDINGLELCISHLKLIVPEFEQVTIAA